MEQQNLKNLIESILFVSGKPLTTKELAKVLEQKPEAIKMALGELISDRKKTGLVILENNNEYQLSTAPENSAQVKDFLNTELREQMTDATLEVLGIISYRQPISKAEIEAIRGVNSQYSIRHLLMRGVIERIVNPNDSRSALYQTTTEFLMHLGLSSPSELPEFKKLVGQIKLPETPALTNASNNNSDALQNNEEILKELEQTEPEDLTVNQDEPENDDDEKGI